jgi:hypothetical protein
METGNRGVCHSPWEPPVIVVSAILRGNLQLSWCLPFSVGTSSYRGVYHSPWEPPVIVVSTSLRGNLQLSWCLPVSVGTSSYPMENGRHHDNWRFPRRMADTTITGGSHGEW